MDAFECPFSLHARTKGAIALQWGDKTWTYKECHQWICGLTLSLQKLGIKPKDKVAIIPDFAFPTPLLLFALFRIKAIAFPLNTHLPPKALKEQLTFTSPSILICKSNNSLAPFPCKTVLFSDLSRITPKTDYPSQLFLTKKTVATYLATSGTTTTPKIAVHSLSNHYYNAIGSNGALPSLKENGRWLLSLPLYHIAGIAILFRTFLAGATLVLTTQRSLSLEELNAQAITHLSLVPTQLRRLLELPPKKLEVIASKLKCLLLGGALIAPSLYHRALLAGLPLFPTYGMTEMSSQITTLTDRSSPLFSLGHPLAYRTCKIGADGEILVKGKTLFQGYLNPDATFNLSLNQDHYFATRDIGSYCQKRGLKLLGRKDRLFISGGENIHPEEIERSLLTIQGVINARVTPIRDDTFGMRPVAHLQTDRTIEIKTLKERLAKELPSYKIPIDFIADNRRN